MAISTVSVGGATKGSQINEIIGVLNGTNSAPTVPAATDTAMWFHQDTAPVEWTIDGTPGDDLLAVKGGSEAYDAAGGTEAGTWTVAGLTKDAHTHSFAQPNAHGITQPTFTYPNHDHSADVLIEKGTGASEAIKSIAVSGGGSCTIDQEVALSNNHNGGAVGVQSDAGISSDGTWRPKARLGIICTKD